MWTKKLTRIICLSVCLSLFSATLTAQVRKDSSAPPKPAREQSQPAPALDTLLAADSYKIYAEVRNVGQVVRSPEVADIIDPIVKLAAPPKEFKLLLQFANAHAETLVSSRMLLAAWPARPKLPQFLLAIEFASPEDAQKFEPKLREFLPTILPPPSPTSEQTEGEVIVVRRAQIRSSAAAVASDMLEVNPGDSLDVVGSIDIANPQDSSRRERWLHVRAHDKNKTKGWIETSNTEAAPKGAPGPATAAKTTEVAEAKQAESKPQPPPFVIKQVGNLVLLSDTAFNLQSLRPAGSKLLAEDANFRQVRDRFQSEPIFFFFNVALDDKSRPAVATVPAEVAPAKQGEPEEADRPVDEGTDMVAPEMTPQSPEGSQPAPVSASLTGSTVVVSDQAQVTAVAVPQDQAVQSSQLQAQPNIDPTIFYSLIGGIAGGQPKWPEAVGAALTFDPDGYALRVLLVNDPSAKPLALPFMPQLISGPPLALGSPSVLPSDTDLFLAMSLDAPQIYEGLVKTLADENARIEQESRKSGAVFHPEAPFAAIEKRLGIKIKDELLPVLGNEVAVTLPLDLLNEMPGMAKAPPTETKSTEAGQRETKAKPSAVILISLKDKEAAHTLLPKVIEGLGFKGASMLAQSEKHDDAEIVSYANAFSYAFIGDFLVLSFDTATTRHVVDYYLNHQTLASDSHYRNATRWQPRQVIGQSYVSPRLMESYRAYANEPTALISDKVRDFLLHVSTVAEPVTYAISNDAQGPLHELHLPKNLVLMMVAAIAGEVNQSPLLANESMARVALNIIASAEASYRAGKGNGSYATLDQLVAEGSVQKELLDSHGYRIELTVSGDKFEAIAVPTEYGKTGRLSYFVNESVVVRGADHAGGPATVADRPIQ